MDGKQNIAVVEPVAIRGECDSLALKPMTAPNDPGRLGTALLRLAERRVEPRGKGNPAAETDLSGSSCGGTGRRAGEDRRAYPRRDSGCDVGVHCLIVDTLVTSQQAEWLLHAAPLRGSLVDLSMNGLAFLLDQPLEASSRVLLRLATRMSGLSVDVSATILRSVQEQSGQWKIVGRFDHTLTLEQVHEFSRYFSAATIV